MHEDHVNATVKDSVLTNNRGNAYLSIYQTAGIDGLLVEGNDIRLADASPLESAQILAPSKVTVQLVLVDGRWLVESFEAAS